MHKILWKINVVDEEMIRNGCNIVSKPICDILFQSESSPQAWSRNAISVHFKVGIVHQHHIIIILLLSSAANVCRNVKWTTTTTTVVVVAVCVMEFLRLFAICQHLPASPRTMSIRKLSYLRPVLCNSKRRLVKKMKLIVKILLLFLWHYI